MGWASEAGLKKAQEEQAENKKRDSTIRAQETIRDEFPGLRDRLFRRIQSDIAEFDALAKQGIRSSVIAGTLEVVKESFPKFTIRIEQPGTAMRLRVTTFRTKHPAVDSEEEEQEIRFSVDADGAPHYLWDGTPTGVERLAQEILGPVLL